MTTTSSKPILTALLLAGLAQVDTAHAVLATGDRLTINSGVLDANGYVVSGSYFAMGVPLGTVIPASAKSPINYSVTMGAGCTSGPVSVAGGIPIGSTITATGAHYGCINGTESPAVDIWEFFNATGMDYITTPITDNGNGTLNFSGWRVTWSGVPMVNMGGGMQDCGTTSDGICTRNGIDTGGIFNNGTGMAAFTWNGVYGGAYILDYFATVPQADPSGFGGVPYSLHLEGTVQPIPIPAAVWLFGSGLLGLVGLARRKKKA